MLHVVNVRTHVTIAVGEKAIAFTMRLVNSVHPSFFDLPPHFLHGPAAAQNAESKSASRTFIIQNKLFLL